MNEFKSYNDLKTDFKGKVPYYFQLCTSEWNKKRNIIISRDNHTCNNCNKKCMDDFMPKMLTNDKVIFVPGIYEEQPMTKMFINEFSGDEIEYLEDTMVFCEVSDPLYAHVHHKNYIFNCLPWEYPDDDLVLLCHKCHMKYHQENIVPVFTDRNKNKIMRFTPCSRCFGIGYFPQFSHVENGICFRCWGAQFEELIMK